MVRGRPRAGGPRGARRLPLPRSGADGPWARAGRVRPVRPQGHVRPWSQPCRCVGRRRRCGPQPLRRRGAVPRQDPDEPGAGRRRRPRPRDLGDPGPRAAPRAAGRRPARRQAVAGLARGRRPRRARRGRARRARPSTAACCSPSATTRPTATARTTRCTSSTARSSACAASGRRSPGRTSSAGPFAVGPEMQAIARRCAAAVGADTFGFDIVLSERRALRRRPVGAAGLQGRAAGRAAAGRLDRRRRAPRDARASRW